MKCRGLQKSAINYCFRWWALFIALFASMVLSVWMGKYPISLPALFHVLSHLSTDAINQDLITTHTVIWQLRLPRLFAACLLGACLAAAGAAYQGMFRNPLVSPDILGVSSGAGLGALLGIVLHWSPLGIQGLAFLGGLLAVGLVVGVASLVRRHDPILVFVLVGVAVSALLSALISLLKVVADPYSELASMTFWLLGGIASVRWQDVLWVLPLVGFSLAWLFLLRWRMDVLGLDDSEAHALGVPASRLRLLFILLATLLTASVVSFAGIVAWVGLLVPHAARLFMGPVFARLLPASVMMGAMFVILADLLARSLSHLEIPLGVVTALVGVPFFLYLLAKGKKSA